MSLHVSIKAHVHQPRCLSACSLNVSQLLGLTFSHSLLGTYYVPDAVLVTEGAVVTR